MSVRGDIGGPDAGTRLPPIDATEGPIVVPDAHLLFNAEYTQVGDDLLLTGGDGTSIVISNYFALGAAPMLFSPEGAVMQPHVVSALVGSRVPLQIAQAGQVELDQPIGQVQDETGTVTAIRDGVPVQLAVGDPVFPDWLPKLNIISNSGSIGKFIMLLRSPMMYMPAINPQL